MNDYTPTGQQMYDGALGIKDDFTRRTILIEICQKYFPCIYDAINETSEAVNEIPEELKRICAELIEAMEHEMNLDEDTEYEHRKLLERAKTVLGKAI